MLSRRHLRIKVLHALYQFFQNEGTDMARGVKKLNENIQSIFDLYLYELKALVELRNLAEEDIERRKNKRLPTADDLNPSANLANNTFLGWLENNEPFAKEVDLNHIRWTDNREIIRKLFKELKDTEEYFEYQSLSAPTVEDDKRFVKWTYGTFISDNELFHHFYDEKELSWADDLDAAQLMLTKTIKRFTADDGVYTELPRLIKDISDLRFAESLYRKVVLKSDDLEQLITKHAKNWETDRIALVDMILMKQALTEFTEFSDIPLNVSLNEYIELSKQYSTPKSGHFINGILDKLKAQMSDDGSIKKIGRGLL